MTIMQRNASERTGAQFRVVGREDAALLFDLLTSIDRTHFRPHPFTMDEAARIAASSGRDVYGMLLVSDRPVAYGMLRGLEEGYETPSLGVAVRTDSQGRGFGRLVMAALHEEARIRGVTTVRLRVDAANVRARRLYESLGYRYAGEDRGELVMTFDLLTPPSTLAARPARLAIKRFVDLVVSSSALMVLLPVLAWISVLVVVTQGRPILFRHRRPGLGGRPFTMVKFRTMRAPRKGEVRYLTDEVRVTRLGRFLRATSLDELPELWNVLRGEMSLVGPRPLLEEYLEVYTSEEHRRHDMRPGITSWAAVNGRHVLGFKERLRLDVWYIDHWSLRLDLRILVMTLDQVVRRKDVATTQDIGAIGFPIPGVDAPSDTMDEAPSDQTASPPVP